MSMKCAEDPLNLGIFYEVRCPSKWACFQTPDTHIRVVHIGVVPPGNM